MNRRRIVKNGVATTIHGETVVIDRNMDLEIRSPAGLQISRRPGEGVEILHGKERLEIRHNGRKGGSYISLRFIGPETFKINRLTKKENK